MDTLRSFKRCGANGVYRQMSCQGITRKSAVLYKKFLSKMKHIIRVIVLDIDYLKKGLDTPPLGVWNLGPSMKKGVYFKNSL